MEWARNVYTLGSDVVSQIVEKLNVYENELFASSTPQNKQMYAIISQDNNYWCNRLKQEFNLPPVPNAEGLYYIALAVEKENLLKACMRTGSVIFTDVVIGRNDGKFEPSNIVSAAVMSNNAQIFAHYSSLISSIPEKEAKTLVKFLLKRKTLTPEMLDAILAIDSEYYADFTSWSMLKKKLLAIVIKHTDIPIDIEMLTAAKLFFNLNLLILYRPAQVVDGLEYIFHTLKDHWKGKAHYISNVKELISNLKKAVETHSELLLLLLIVAIQTNDEDLFDSYIERYVESGGNISKFVNSILRMDLVNFYSSLVTFAGDKLKKGDLLPALIEKDFADMAFDENSLVDPKEIVKAIKGDHIIPAALEVLIQSPFAEKIGWKQLAKIIVFYTDYTNDYGIAEFLDSHPEVPRDELKSLYDKEIEFNPEGDTLVALGKYLK